MLVDKVQETYARTGSLTCSGDALQPQYLVDMNFGIKPLLENRVLDQPFFSPRAELTSQTVQLVSICPGRHVVGNRVIFNLPKRFFFLVEIFKHSKSSVMGVLDVL